MTIETLNERFAIADVLSFQTGIAHETSAVIRNDSATAEISLHGGNVLSYTPTGEAEDVLFVSSLATSAGGKKAIRGGVPVCWPWFGPAPADGLPNHGFVRDRPWDVIATEAIDPGTTKLTLGLSATDETRTLWPQSFELAFVITVGQSLSLDLITRNTGDASFTMTQGLHTYFKIGDIDRVCVRGFDGKRYIDKVDGATEKTQTGDITIAGEVDRIYLDVAPEMVIDDAALARRIVITSSGNSTAVIWNPWIEKAAGMGDLGNDDYKTMLCAETTNAASDIIEIPAGQEFCLHTDYRIDR